jgi:glycine cleavage system regulatory protein
MQSSLVMTFIGKDRPGLVDSVAALVTEHGGNWLESRMSRLGGQFAGILRVMVPSERETELVEALQRLRESHGLTTSVQADRSPATASGPTRVLEVVGQDRPGIVRQISRVLADHSVNVEELHTECGSAAMSGETVFTARAKVGIPPRCDLAELRQQLEQIAGDIMVDISWEDEEKP